MSASFTRRYLGVIPTGDRHPALKTCRIRVWTFEKVMGTGYPFFLPMVCLIPVSRFLQLHTHLPLGLIALCRILLSINLFLLQHHPLLSPVLLLSESISIDHRGLYDSQQVRVQV